MTIQYNLFYIAKLGSMLRKIEFRIDLFDKNNKNEVLVDFLNTRDVDDVMSGNQQSINLTI